MAQPMGGGVRRRWGVGVASADVWWGSCCATGRSRALSVRRVHMRGITVGSTTQSIGATWLCVSHRDGIGGSVAGAWSVIGLWLVSKVWLCV